MEQKQKPKLKTYYKVLRSNMTHNDLKFQFGLNYDIVPFNPKGKCEAGGIYYTTLEFIGKFLRYGGVIAEVIIPDDAQVYADPDGDKWKADKIYIKKLQFIKDWSKWKDTEFCASMLKQNWYAFKFIKKQTYEMCMEAVKKNGLALEYVKEQTYEMCMEAVKQNGYALQFVKEQTPEICLEAIKEESKALGYVKEQTEEICIEAIKEYAKILKYVKEQTKEMCMLAVKQNGLTLQYVKSQDTEICFAALMNTKDALKYVVNNKFIEILFSSVKRRRKR